MEVIESKSRIFAFGHSAPTLDLLKEILEKHPQLEILGDSFQEAYTSGPEKLERRDHGDADYPEARRKVSSDETYQKAFDRLQKSMRRAEQEGKRPLFTEDAYMIFRPDVTSTKLEHDRPLTTVPTPVIMTSKTMPTNFRCPLRASNSPRSSDSPLFTATFPIFHPITEGLGIHTIESRSPNANPTVLPDAFLKSMTLVCLIRHPALTVPSSYRMAHLDIHGSEFHIKASLRWCRLLVEWYNVATGTKPIILDGEDLIHKPVTVTKLCRALSFDEAGAQTSRDALSQAELREQDAMTPAINATTQTSTGVERSSKRVGKIDVEEEAKSWETEFGVDTAETIKKLVVDAMDDYSYLRQYAIN